VNHPIAALLAAFAAGVAVLQTCPRLPPLAWALLATAACLTAMTLFVHRRVCERSAPAFGGTTPPTVAAAMASVVAAGLLGFSYAAVRAQVRLGDALPPAWEARDIVVTGIVDDLPQQSPSGARFAFAVTRVETAGAIVPRRLSLAWFAPRLHPPQPGDAADVADVHTDGSARGSVDGPQLPVAPFVHAGECWSLVVRLRRPHGNVNPDGFDLEAWLLEHGLRATGYVRESPANAQRCAFAGRFADHVQRTREAIRARIAQALPDAPYAGVLTALTIGDQRAIPETQWNVFNRTGVTHLVSISGLHVTVFAMLAAACTLVCVRRSTLVTTRIPARKIAAAAGVAFAFGYVQLAGAEVPAVRTLLMLVVAAAGLWIGRPGTASLVWLWSLVVVLVWDPWATLAPGFWLSFGAVGLLLYAGGGRLTVRGPQSFRHRAVHALRESAHAQGVVTLGLVPGTLALFQQVSLVSALANALAIPIVTLLIVPIALTAIPLPLDAPWRIAHAILAVLMRYLEWLAASPAAVWITHAPRGFAVVVAIAGVAWIFAPRGIPGRAFGIAWLLPMTLIPPPAVPWGGVRVVVLDVGQGLAVFVATARHALVYDTGPRFNDAIDAGARIVAPFLRAAGITHLDALVVSHADNDHSGGAGSILRAFPVAWVLSSLAADHPLVAQARGAAQTMRCLAGTRWVWDDVTFTVLHPAASDYDEPARKSNDLSCVVRVEAANGSVLLTGDIEALTEAQLLKRTPEGLRSQVLVVPHHGSRTSSTPAFVDAVAPAVAIIAAGYRNRFGHPRSDVLARYRQAGAARPRTDLGGAISVQLAPGAPLTVETERIRRRRYWYDATTE
jgi:competence protein ComEC